MMTPQFIVHNLVAHPLLVLWPRVGEWLHAITAPADDLAPISMVGRLLADEKPLRIVPTLVCGPACKLNHEHRQPQS